MGVDRDIWLALTDRLLALSLTPALPIEFDNDENDTDVQAYDGGWMDVKLFKNRNQRETIDGIHRRLGFLQVAIKYPQGVGTVTQIEIAEQIQAWFPADMKFPPVTITELPTIGNGLKDGAWWALPVTIYWETFA